MLSFLKNKKKPVPAVSGPPTDEIKQPEKKQIFGKSVAQVPEVNPLLEKLLGGEAGLADKAIDKQKLGPGITCKVTIRSPAGVAEPDP